MTKIIYVLLLVVGILTACSGTSAEIAPIEVPNSTPVPAASAEPTISPEPTATPEPTPTSTPIADAASTGFRIDFIDVA